MILKVQKSDMHGIKNRNLQFYKYNHLQRLYPCTTLQIHVMDTRVFGRVIFVKKLVCHFFCDAKRKCWECTLFLFKNRFFHESQQVQVTYYIFQTSPKVSNTLFFCAILNYICQNIIIKDQIMLFKAKVVEQLRQHMFFGNWHLVL